MTTELLITTQALAADAARIMGRSEAMPEPPTVFERGSTVVHVGGTPPDGHLDSFGRSGSVCDLGSWPHPLGMRVEFNECGWSIDLDRVGYQSIYYSKDATGDIEVVSTRPEWVAAVQDRKVDLNSLVELLTLGFLMSTHSPFEGVHRLRVGERLVAGDRPNAGPGGIRLETGGGFVPGDASDWQRNASEVVAAAFADGLAIELSGGVDSRLILALGLAGGEKPRVAITLGGEEFEDTHIARAICKKVGIEHVVVRPPDADPDQIVADGRAFVRAGSYSISATYSGLPATFRLLEPHRSGQVGGLGGELAMGFYYTPLDRLCDLGFLRQWWLRKRVLRSGQADRPSYFGRSWDDRRSALESRLLEAFGRGGGSWRERSDRFYFEERMSQWAGHVIQASSSHYRAEHPFLKSAYLDWARGLGASARKNGRRLQMKAIHDAHPELGSMPYCEGERYRPGLRSALEARGRSARKLGSKILKRLRRSRNLPDLGRLGVIPVLAALPEIQASIRAFVADYEDVLDPSGIDGLFSTPLHHEHDLGMLLTCAWAREELMAVRGS